MQLQTESSVPTLLSVESAPTGTHIVVRMRDPQAPNGLSGPGGHSETLAMCRSMTFTCPVTAVSPPATFTIAALYR